MPDSGGAGGPADRRKRLYGLQSSSFFSKTYRLRLGCLLKRRKALRLWAGRSFPRREELEKKRADEKAKLKRMQSNRRKLLREQIKRARSRLSSAKRRRRNQRLIQLGLLLEVWNEEDSDLRDRTLKALDDRLTRNDLRELFGLAPLDKPAKPGTPSAGALTASQDDPIPGFRPKRLDGGSWGAIYEGDTSKLPDELVGRRIVVTRASKKSWVATVLAVVKRTERLILVRRTDPPTA